MTLKEMQACAAETLSYFLKVMPDAPFGKDDIVIEFVKRQDMAERAKALCALYRPNKVFNETQEAELVTGIAANALIGREKSAVIVRINYKQTKGELHRILFHELMHIFCAKLEMDGEHFIDIYGSGHTPDMNPEDKIYDGQLNSGYVMWSEFIAQYYALVYAEDAGYCLADIAEFVVDILCSISIGSKRNDKAALGMICAYILTCEDAEDVLLALHEPGVMYPDDEPASNRVREALLNVLLLLRERLQNEKPWKITEGFIADLGSLFIWFKTMNSAFLGEIEL